MTASSAAIDYVTSRVHIDDNGCWLWLGYIRSNGYGQASIAGRQGLAHRAAYINLVGEIPEGLELDHLCRVRRCVNPEHLEPVTRQVNQLRGETIAAANAAKTHCAQGHPLSGANLTYDRGKRRCVECRRMSVQRARDKRASQITSQPVATH